MGDLGEDLRRLVEELEVDEVERLDGVALLNDTGDAAERRESGLRLLL